MMTKQRPARAVLGAAGEDFAADYLSDLGMQVLDRNWRCREGEIDIVLLDGDEIVICEVKTRRTTTYGQPIEAITRAKFARLRRLAGRWLADHEVDTHRVRLDIVALLKTGESYKVNHVRGAWQ